MPIMFNNGKILFRNSKIAMSEGCCCSGSGEGGSDDTGSGQTGSGGIPSCCLERILFGITFNATISASFIDYQQPSATAFCFFHDSGGTLIQHDFFGVPQWFFHCFRNRWKFYYRYCGCEESGQYNGVDATLLSCDPFHLIGTGPLCVTGYNGNSIDPCVNGNISVELTE